MKTLNQQLLTGERALFKARDLTINNTTFADGESPLKESQNIALTQAIFKWKYPLWYSQHVTVDNSLFETMSRSGIWYTHDITINNSTLQAPKLFRRASQIKLNHVHFSDAEETLWNCQDIELNDVQATGDYFGMNSENIKAQDFSLVGNYAFDGAKNIEIHNATLMTKDAFWNCENVTVYDSQIIGEYLGWNSKHIRFVNCTIESDQGLCYMDDVTLENCTLLNTDLAFEYCRNIKADINSTVDSIKNPISGEIHAAKIGKIIFDDPEIDPHQTTISVDTEQEVPHAV
ncbi:DUF3737 family protein [Lactiplantibacillus mudanjiangensis]|uniref:Uncharacterized protein n=1 Tax=Lactiplantibacillus mudanjiangensis TaxID=1296538 RepID=A0A660DWD7_9LACO|nr:DUF3737 family protein [Lactiplantibacillus mudanjiangensis]VDG20073.1 hypothetical protein MUDAN_BIHEEGNE_01698 [Lactiplantibacillus mudanjiangensis]VDG26230.1 hypothetical protein MUDAN_IGPPGNFN_01584 [Lactiplantibacillus mudanjiangensis]VDG27390.1 hypothetical protein MUDAN_MDHGFNIF_02275 [Lactiplantibacillus mudanjiangensis]